MRGGERLPDLFVLLVLGATYLLVRGYSFVPLEESRLYGIELPDRIGDWFGSGVYFCHNETCLREINSDEPLLSCPSCGSALVRGWSLAEKRQLPPDTWLARRKYRNASGTEITVAIVLSGIEQVSLHRPQICLAGQGFDMAGERTVRFGGGTGGLDVRLLKVYRRWRLPSTGAVEWGGYYAYWFTDGNHVTPYHLVRMFHAAFDRVFYGRARRWAYVAITGRDGPDGRIPEETIGEFAILLHRHLMGRLSGRAGNGADEK